MSGPAAVGNSKESSPEPTGRASPFTWFAAIFVVAYMGIFYYTPLAESVTHPDSGEPIRRFEYQTYLLLSPDDMINGWTGTTGSPAALLDRTSVLFVSLVILALAYVAGRLMLDWLHVTEALTSLERIVFSLGAGLNVLSLMTLAMGLLGVLRGPLFFLPPAAIVLASAVRRYRRRGQAATAPRSDELHQPRGSADWSVGLLVCVAMPFVLVIVGGAMLPPRDFDVREYHLQIPKEWYQQGSIDFVPHNVYGNMPLGAEMHALLGMILMPGPDGWWWGALVGKTVIAFFVPLATLALFATGRRLFGSAAGVVAGLLFISTPWMVYVSMAGLIDGAVACYLLLAALAVILWWHYRPGEGRRSTTAGGHHGDSAEWTGRISRRSVTGLLALGGFLAGSAVACKYPALLFVALPLTLFVVVCDRSWKTAAVFLIAVGCGCALWFGKNAVLAHNPTYPLMDQVFEGRNWDSDKDQQWRRAHSIPRDEEGRRYSFSSLGDAAREVLLSSRWLSPLLIPFASLSLLATRRRRLAVWLICFSLFILASWWLFTHRIDRFWIPVVAFLALLAGLGATWTNARGWYAFVIVVLAIGSINNFLLVASPVMGDVRFFVPLEQLRQEIHPAHQFLNEAVPDGTSVLLVGDAQPFDLKVPALYNTCFDGCLFEQLMKGRSAEARTQVLLEKGISFIFVDWNELARYRSPGNYGYAAGSDFVQPEQLETLVEQGVLEEPIAFPVSMVSPSDHPPPQVFRVKTPAMK